MIGKCYNKMWTLRNLNNYGADESQLVLVYIQQIRSVLEMSCPVWNAGLSQQDIRSLETVQRTALAIIMGVNHTGYKSSMSHLKLDDLVSRGHAICTKYALKAFKIQNSQTGSSEISNGEYKK